ncbi:phosphate ABC transporter membrane protein 2 PhoT family (TC 3.A.1.7.1) [Coprococcus sp. CAG:782]|jgi:phosphate transport system permease protein|uniref:phosphate ABC transporter permease PstA n=1 Tax=Coprococcus sp. OM04-5BH TaxID=2293093 RepID=UPI0003367099|nr:phosphate ABC transporter permease PstA [Coprococcus sp. OM04-5BH]MEE0036000.1 phosphate ABC transporter permease PstA [Coprococcus sp.]RHV34752.1 phosphate ABC transporter permease PstA [Coprococcus sp. OM04-5BH]CCY53901.1 phosphate ABC transporter membrane protein 2 PhoT family (TC 3.A.1.7.1) [Coprococcus sp. CAG:782]
MNNNNRSRKIKDYFMYALIYICAGFSVILLVGIILYVFAKGIKTVDWSFLTSVTSVLKGTKGIAGNIVNTLIIILITMVIATPIGIGSAIYLNEYAKPGKLVSIIEYATETLAGIPSIIFGLFGMMFFVEKLKLGYSLLAGSFTLILMILPLITRNTQEALKTVPASYRSGAIGLGSGKWHMIRTILIPSAMPGIITGVILAIGRIVGESAALLLTAGSAKLLPQTFEQLLKKPTQSGGTLTIQMYLSATSEGDFDTAFGIAVVLLVIVLLINIGTKALTRHFDVSRKD